MAGQLSKDTSVHRMHETPEHVADSIGKCLDYLDQEALAMGLTELSHLIGVAALAAKKLKLRNGKSQAFEGHFD